MSLLLAALTSDERMTTIAVDIEDYMHNCQDPASSHFTHLEDMHFTYRKIL